MCDLTTDAMEALLNVASVLEQRDPEQLTSLQLRTLLWSRSSLAVLYGIRAEESFGFEPDSDVVVGL